MATKLPYLNVLEVESVNKDEVSRAIVIDKDEYVKALDIEQITTYQGLSDKPKINGVELNGDISLDELNVASKNDLNKVISDVEKIIDDLPTSENIQDKIDDSLMNYPTKSEVTTEINNSIADKADKSEIPTKVSQLDNDEGFISSIPDEYVTETELNSSVSSKQDILVSGENIKTINNESILGSGNINIDIDLEGYATEQWVEDKGYLTSESLTTINNNIDELETSKQETFQVNQPLAFSRFGDDLVLDVNLENYVTDSELSNKQDKLTTGDNIDITDNTISWVAPDVQFVNTIFTDDESLKYAVSDFSGTYTEKEFPVATQESAGLMSAADKVKLDNAGIPYLQVDNNSIVSGSFTDVYSAIQNNKPYLIKVYIAGTAGIWGDPEQVYISGANLEMFASYHPVDGSYIQVMWTVTPDGTVTKREWDLDLATQTEVDAKQDTLVSGTNIKTINGESILGEGDLVVSGSGSSDYNDLTNKPSIEGVTLEGYLDAHYLNLAELSEFVPVKDRVDANLPYYLKCGTSTIIEGDFDDVYNAIKNNKNYRLELMLVNLGSTASSYFGQPEVVRIEGDNIVCYASIHYAGEYQRSTWTISSTGVTVTSGNFNLVETETYSGSVPQVEKMITLTQEEYDQLSGYDENVLYIII